MTALNVQLARDEIAHVLGGTQVRAGVYAGAGALSAGGKSIKFAYGRVIEPGSLGEDGVCAIVMFGGTSVLEGGGDLSVYTHRLPVELVLSVARSMLHEADAILTPFIPVIRNAFAGKVKLNAAADACELESISEIKDSIYRDRLAIEFVLRVTQKEAVAYAA
jgi:hypothetical protein